MSFINYISFTKAVSFRIKPTQRDLPFFKGSSLNRKQDECKKTTSEVCSAINENEKRKQAVNSLRINSAFERSTAKQDTKRNNDRVRTFSRRSRDKCRNKIFALFETSGTNFTFLTLTMIGECSDQAAQKCLNKFLTVLRKRYGLFSYIWVAERQKNGRIHFHFILDRRFPIQSINKLWVLQQYNAGIENEKYPYHEILQAYEKNILHRLLNPVDVRTVRNRNALSGYLTQYLTKNEGKFTCAVWHCNRAISALFTSSLINDHDFAETGSKQNRYVSKKGKVFQNKTFAVTDKNSGKVLALVNNIFNKDYFSKHHRVMNDINRLILEKINAREVKRGEDIFKRLRFSYNDLFVDGYEWLN